MTAPLLLLTALAFAFADAAAAEQAGDGSNQAGNPPDAELLEYIAGFEPVDGAWMDPMQLYDTFVAGGIAKENDHE